MEETELTTSDIVDSAIDAWLEIIKIEKRIQELEDELYDKGQSAEMMCLMMDKDVYRAFLDKLDSKVPHHWQIDILQRTQGSLHREFLEKLEGEKQDGK